MIRLATLRRIQNISAINGLHRKEGSQCIYVSLVKMSPGKYGRIEWQVTFVVCYYPCTMSLRDRSSKIVDYLHWGSKLLFWCTDISVGAQIYRRFPSHEQYNEDVIYVSKSAGSFILSWPCCVGFRLVYAIFQKFNMNKWKFFHLFIICAMKENK